MKNCNQAASASFSMAMPLLFLFFFFFNSASARVFKVGDDFGWQQPTTNTTTTNYSQWATKHRFHVGDSLMFEYKNDSVAEVDEWGYSHCNTSTSMVAFDNGNSSFKLEKPGPFYFISGNFSHCKHGQLLLVEVMHQHHHIMAPQPAYANPPEGSSSSSSSSMEPPSSSTTNRQPSSAVIVSVIVSSVTVVLIATFVALAWCSP
ncbi:Early nodulin-like protein 1 [Linum perenne]